VLIKYDKYALKFYKFVVNQYITKDKSKIIIDLLLNKSLLAETYMSNKVEMYSKNYVSLYRLLVILAEFYEQDIPKTNEKVEEFICDYRLKDDIEIICGILIDEIDDNLINSVNSDDFIEISKIIEDDNESFDNIIKLLSKNEFII